MFTAKHQQRWPYGSLRLINCSGIPAQALYSTERIQELNSDVFQHRDDDVWVVSYVKSGTTWTIGILAALWDHPAAINAGNIQKMTRTFCPQPELPGKQHNKTFGDLIRCSNTRHKQSSSFIFSFHSLMRESTTNFFSYLGWGDDGFGHSLQELNDWPANPRRCLKSHWPNQDFLKTNTTGGKYIYVMRNPIDQMISHWNQVWGMGFHYGKFTPFVSISTD